MKTTVDYSPSLCSKLPSSSLQGGDEKRKASGLGTVRWLAEKDETDPAKEKELRNLFALYDVNKSGFVDTKEIVSALQGNYTQQQVMMHSRLRRKRFAHLCRVLAFFEYAARIWIGPF